jgi:hypothetical protein
MPLSEKLDIDDMLAATVAVGNIEAVELFISSEATVIGWSSQICKNFGNALHTATSIGNVRSLSCFWMTAIVLFGILLKHCVHRNETNSDIWWRQSAIVIWNSVQRIVDRE